MTTTSRQERLEALDAWCIMCLILFIVFLTGTMFGVHMERTATKRVLESSVPIVVTPTVEGHNT